MIKKKISALILSLSILTSVSSVKVHAIDSTYTVKSGDTLWKISQTYNVSVTNLKTLNNLTTDYLYVGQVLKLTSTASTSTVTTNPISIKDSVTFYTVQSGDTLWGISTKYGVSVSEITQVNKLVSSTIYLNQKLVIPYGYGYNWDTVQTYVVQAGDTATSIGNKLGKTASDIMKYNYMTQNDWFNAGQTIAVNKYAPRQYSVIPNSAITPSKYGVLVDWFNDGQYLIKRNDTFKIVDIQTGKSFNVKMLGGYNHSDIEPLTLDDTNVMKSVFGTWNWSPRPVVIFKDGMSIAGSLSGMPHSYDSTPYNGVSGHFDLYMFNSKPHADNTSTTYVAEHRQAVLKASGQ